MQNNLYLSQFWTRIWALLIDTIVLGVFGFIIGILFKNLLISIGENAKIIGWMISLAYFTILNSNLNNGQTLGKKIMNIQVTNIHGNAVDLKTSFIRALILTMPFFLNDLKLFGTNIFSIATVIQSIIAFTLGIGIILVYILNNENRQSIHDAIVKTYVVQNYRNDEVTFMPKFSKTSLYILSVVFLFVSSFSFYNFVNTSKVSKLIPVYESIIKQDNISGANVFMNFSPLIDSSGTKHFIYTVTIRTNKITAHKKNIEANINQREVKQTVETFIRSKVYETDSDILNIVVLSGFDIGIARQTYSYNIYKSIHNWKETYAL